MGSFRNSMGLTTGLALLGLIIGIEESRGLEETTRTVSVSGEAIGSFAPNVGEISLGVVSEGKDAGEALQSNRERMNALFEALEAAGVERKSIQTTQVNLSPVYTFEQNDRGRQRKVSGFQASNSVRIETRDLKTFGSLIDAVVKAGANQISGIQFRTELTDAQRAELRRQAMRDAVSRATILVESVGMRLGDPLKITESSSSDPQPVVMAMTRGMEAMSAPTPIAPGEQELRVSVSVTFTMEPADR